MQAVDEWEDEGNVSVASSSILYPPRGIGSPRRSVHRPSPRKRPGSSVKVPLPPAPQQSRPRNPARQPGMADTLSYVLWPVKVLLSPLSMILSPILSHTRNVLILASLLALLSWWIWPYIQSLFHPLSIIFFIAKMPFAIVSSLRPSLNSGDQPHFWSGPQQAVQGLWCETVGYGCHPSVQQGLSPVMVARALTREARTASDIFGSIARLGEGGVEGGLHHIKYVYEAPSDQSPSHDPQNLGACVEDHDRVVIG